MMSWIASKACNQSSKFAHSSEFSKYDSQFVIRNALYSAEEKRSSAISIRFKCM
jgi:hypothetical protein